MKTILTALLTLVVGCGKKEEKQTPVMGPASHEVQASDLAETKAKAAAESKAAAEAKAGAWVSDPNDPNNVIIEKNSLCK